MQVLAARHKMVQGTIEKKLTCQTTLSNATCYFASAHKPRKVSLGCKWFESEMPAAEETKVVVVWAVR